MMTLFQAHKEADGTKSARPGNLLQQVSPWGEICHPCGKEDSYMCRSPSFRRQFLYFQRNTRKISKESSKGRDEWEHCKSVIWEKENRSMSVSPRCSWLQMWYWELALSNVCLQLTCVFCRGPRIASVTLLLPLCCSKASTVSASVISSVFPFLGFSFLSKHLWISYVCKFLPLTSAFPLCLPLGFCSIVLLFLLITGLNRVV